MSSMLPSVVSSVFNRKSSWKTTLPPSIGPFNGKNQQGKKSPAASPAVRKKGYWCRTPTKERTIDIGSESPRIRHVYIRDGYRDIDDGENDDNTKATEEDQTEKKL
ncbi:uncharacterized protein LOC144451590 [Glandiceps talaboti]